MAIETSELITDPDDVIDSWPDLTQALSYWRSKVKDGRIPGRDDIDPLDVTEILPQINLIDVVAQPDGHYRYRHRMEGTMLVERFKRSSTGKWFDENYDPGHLEKQLRAYDDAARTHRPNLARIQIVDDEIVTIDYTRLIMPLAPAGEPVNMLFAVFSFNTFNEKSGDALPIHRQ